MARNYAALPHDYLKEMELLTDAEFGRLCRALLKYSSTGEKEELGGNERVLFPRVMLQEDRFQASYEERSEKLSRRGKNGANARWSDASDAKACSSMQSNAKHGNTKTETETDIYTLPSNDGKSDNTRVKRFTPPTLAEVQSYVAERHSPVDPQGFIDFYEAKGWMVGKTPMKDWKAACRNAEKWERWRKKGNSADYLLHSIMEDLQHDGNRNQGLPVSHGPALAELSAAPERGGDDGGGKHLAAVFREHAGESGHPDDPGDLR